MKLLLDLQGIQCQSRHRGIGRYTLALTHAFLARAAERHDIRLVFNSQFGSATDELIAAFGEHAAPSRRVMLEMPSDTRAQLGGNEWRRHGAERVMRYALDALDADIIWHSSVFEGYADDVVMPDAPLARTATAATLYDLIPLHDPSAHLDFPRVRQWYENRVETLRRSQLLFAISEWVRQDAIQRLDLPPDRVIHIGAAVDSRFVPPAVDQTACLPPYKRHGITRSFVLYNGGFDPRKNVATLIQAFAALPPVLRTAYQLVIVGRIKPEEKSLLETASRKAQLPADSLVYTGFVEDSELVRLYGDCSLFIFPSILEGFGLPPLEAMACGAPVIASNTASLPDVIGRRDALFDPLRADDITARMSQVLSNPGFAAELRQYGIRHASGYTWDTVAARALEALEVFMDRRPRAHDTAQSLPTKRPSLTCVLATNESPVLLDELKAHYDILRIDHNVDTSATSDSIPDAGRILYMADTNSVLRLEKSIRARPGTLLILGHELSGTPAQWPSDRMTLQGAYKGGGYQALLNIDRTQCIPTAIAWLPLLDCALGVLASDVHTLHEIRVHAQAMPLPDMATLPATGAAAFCAVMIERAHATHSLAHEARLLDNLSQIPGIPNSDDIAQIATAAVAARPALSTRQWLVDVSSIATNDIGTGVQRVVRNVLRHWLEHPPTGFRIEPVRFVDGRYHYARRYALGLLDLADLSLDEDAVDVGHGDTFIGLDWIPQSMAAAEPQLRDWHRRGVALNFVVYDVLPVTLPETFHPFARDQFTDWLRLIASIADRLICISQATVSEVHEWLTKAKLLYQFGTMPTLGHFPLGVESSPKRTSSPEAIARPQLSKAMQARPSLLMVGTIEPRKGYDQALDACQLLWTSDVDFNLIIIGHRGWLMDALIARLDRHAERDHRLFWFDDMEDAELDAVYAASTALVAASWGEGYGLPLIEAAQRRLPVIARDLPIFREVMGDYASYVEAPSADDLARALREWLASPPSRRTMLHCATWEQSAKWLADMIHEPNHPGWSPSHTP